MTVITRFAPSPTGLLHIGNIRTALINWLFTRKMGGKFILRMDDTDLARSKEEYAEGIKRDLTWMHMNWDDYKRQSDRYRRYEEVKQALIASGRLYPCYETPEELELKRKLLLKQGLPPIYDRAALKMTKEEAEKTGRKPHYRFLLQDSPIIWQDMIKGEIRFEGKNISDPVVIREDGSMTYILCSVIDDIDFNITHIVRGEDHVTNTAIHIQMFEALGGNIPSFAHLALIQSKGAEISKRVGGFDIKNLRENHIEAMVISSMLAKLGSSDSIEVKYDMQELINEFDIKKFSCSPANYDLDELLSLNHKYIANLDYIQAKQRLQEENLSPVPEDFWLLIRGNINKINEIEEWWNICKSPITPAASDHSTIKLALDHLPAGEIDDTSWDSWINNIKKHSNVKGKALFMPLRLALTGKNHGPELKYLLKFIGKDEITRRLKAVS